MKIRLYGSALLLGLLAYVCSFGQDFSNKGKEFWLAYCYHVGMVNAGGSPTMTLYITSDVNTSYAVEIYGVTTIQSGNLTAGQVVQVNIPTTYFINNEGIFTNKTIRVTGDKPIVVYSYITRSAASGATLCLPTNVLGKEYYSTNFTQVSNEQNSNSFFTIIAVENNTSVEITPSSNTKNGWLANNTYTINLNKGEIYQVLGTVNGVNGSDLTGSKIKSIAGGLGGCKRIAVFSGSGKIMIPPGGCTDNSSDNLYQQLYPTGTWGKKYLTVPSFNRPNNYYRITRSDPASNITLNGVAIPASSFTNNYYQFFNALPNKIESDKPISVAQYFTTQNCDGNGNPYDPDMIILNPVEQNIDKVTLVSSNVAAAQPQHHIHVIMRNGGTGLSSFTIDGNPPPTAWTVHPADPTYSYLYLSNVSQGYHKIASDSGFNAIAYGYGQAESYGYSAGANVKDLYQFVSIRNEYATVNFPAACRNSPFYFSMTFPYQPTQIQWQFGGLFTDVTINNPVPDSSWTVNGKTLYLYKLTQPYTITTIGTYPIKVLAQNPTPDGCSGEQEINYDLQVFARPVADFNFTSTGCVSDSVRFFDNANTNGRPAIRWSWNFGDGNTDVVRNPVHLYNTSGSFNVKYSTITDIGCLSDTVSKTVTLNPAPVAKFGISAPTCAGKLISFSDSSFASIGNIIKWYWNFGDGSPVIVATNNNPQSHIYALPGTYQASLKVETSSGCQSTVFSRQVPAFRNLVTSFSFGNGCLPAGVSFTNTTPVGNSPDLAPASCLWDFGDGNTDVNCNPVHVFTGIGPYQVKLIVTSEVGCQDDTTITVATIFPKPIALFTAPQEICLGATATFQDQSTAPNSSIVQWQWDFGDGINSTVQNPSHVYAAAGTYQVSLKITSAASCVSEIISKQVIVNALPVAGFTISQPNCLNRDIVFTDISIPNAGSLNKWSWDFGDGNTVVNTSSAAVTHNYASTGNYSVSLKVETNKGCVSTVFTKPLAIHPLPKPGFILPDNCVVDPFSQFTDTSSIDDGTQAQFTYLWNFGDAFATPANPNTSTIKNPKHKYSQEGQYDVSLSVNSINGCTSSITRQLIVNSSQPQSIFNVSSINPQCSNLQVNINDQSSISVGRIIKMEIFWDDLNDPTIKSTITFPISGTGYNHSYPEFFIPATKDFQIRVKVYSGDSCFQSAIKTITLKATPQIVFNPIQGVCADQPAFQLTQASVINGLPGTETYSGNGISSSGIFNPQTAGVGLHTLRYTFTGTNGCINFVEQQVAVFSVPVVNAGPDKFVLEGGNAVLQGSATGNNLSYSWTPVTGLNNPSILQPITSPTADINYTLEVLSADGCKASDQVFVKFLKAPTIPNVFTPNGDGINDFFDIKYLESYPGATVEIYNRYGQLIFQSTGYTKPWDGTLKGKQVPAGTYYYIINPKNGRKQMSGFVDIVR